MDTYKHPELKAIRIAIRPFAIHTMANTYAGISPDAYRERAISFVDCRPLLP